MHLANITLLFILLDTLFIFADGYQIPLLEAEEGKMSLFTTILSTSIAGALVALTIHDYCVRDDQVITIAVGCEGDYDAAGEYTKEDFDDEFDSHFEWI